MAKTSGSFRFRHGDNVGAADADNDGTYLDTCFVDNGDINVLLNCSNPHCIVVGRTGSGKTALLLELEKRAKDHTERISPDSLSLNYIANCDIVHSLTSLGVNLDPFFKLLWRHVLALQIFQHIHPVAEDEKGQGPLAWLTRLLREDKTSQEKRKRHTKVMEFLQKHGSNEFWGDVGHRVEGMVYKFEQAFQTQTGRSFSLAAGVTRAVTSASADIGTTRDRVEKSAIAAEVTVEERQRFQNVVNEMHIRELDGILALVAEVLEDAGRNVYIIIDRLDLGWADESIRLRLIRALVDTVVAFAPIPRVKVILALRVDLIERVYRDARHQPGTQSEKAKDYYLTLSWDRPTLLKMLDARVAKLVRDRFAPGYAVKVTDVTNPTIRKGRNKGVKTADFMMDRTWNRPRDLIDLLNACISRSGGKPKITDDALIEAEGEYSRNRLKSLSEEWQLEYPYLEETIRKVLRGRSRRLRVSEISDDDLCDWVRMVELQPPQPTDRIRAVALSLDQSERSFDEVRNELATILYKVGVVGVQTDEEERPQWANNFSYSLSPDEIAQASYLYIHNGLWKALGVE